MRKTLKLLLLIPLCFSLSFCKQKTEVPEKLVSNDLVLIVDNEMNSVPISIFKNYDFKDNDQVHFYTEKTNDTLNIPINTFQSIFLSSRFAPKIPLIINTGDTLFVNLKDSILTYKISKSHEYSIPKLSLNLSQKGKKIQSIQNRFYQIDSTKPLQLKPSKYEKFTPLYPIIKNKELIANKDSLKNITLLELDFLKNSIAFYDSLSSNNIKNIGFYKILKEETEGNTFRNLLRLHNLSNDDFILKNITSNQFINDSLVNNKNLLLFMNTYINKKILKDRKSTSRSGHHTNYKFAYEALANHFDNDLLMYSRMLCLNRMVEQEDPYEDILFYYEDFKKHHSDSVFTNSFDKKIRIELSKLRTLKDDVILITSDASQLSLDSLIKTNKNKLIYIDFWASWCAPCIAAMPDSRILVNEYKEKDVVFVYISIDKDSNKWEKASREEDLFSFENNLLAVNYPNANFYKDLKIQTIPRYILFDKNGKLVQPNAPGPGGGEIRKLLDEHLKE
ncbi:MAG TPA: TlpA disulfide reductase family protein [Gelidibacter sp.]|uniref:TlpA family protein disulfide reductase n=1 Tax=Gelidibacter sp. TaxID=2018083 RepID=UPI002BE75422|nr:TlpA disulfide reductase family protein [Gelidibacter sp.]HTO15756.1 TlpA disulfide reductase family protein [Edaphocola sp.]HXJ97778.1 TlpA disulfide reductase family protein [Gelidibacter sp.]